MLSDGLRGVVICDKAQLELDAIGLVVGARICGSLSLQLSYERV